MATTIRLKRSGITPVPTELRTGELAYSWENSTGGKLYIGYGDEELGLAPNIVPIGGQYYTGLVTNRISHTPGILTANSAIIVDSTSTINNIKVGNLNLISNTISSTTANTDIILDPNGNGTINVSNSRITNIATPTLGTDAVNKDYVDVVFGVDATTTTKGIAKFGGWSDDTETARQFSVTAGDVKIILLDAGSY